MKTWQRNRLLILFVCFVSTAMTRLNSCIVTPPDSGSKRTLRAVGILSDPKPSNPTGVGLVLKDTGTVSPSPCLLLEDVQALRWIEDNHRVILEDQLCGDLTGLDITLAFRGIRSTRVSRGGRRYERIETYEGFQPVNHKGEAITFTRLHPPRPSEDTIHRYILVPVDYSRPGGETFPLYYELNRDFDPRLPTIMIPSDAQRSFSQVGWADRYKKIFSTKLNVVIFEYRGTFCSPIPGLGKRNIDWNRAWRVYHSDMVVEDMERIRRHLLGHRPIHILGGSGTAMMGLKYLARYHEHVERAYLMSFFKDAAGSSGAGIRFFKAFLDRHNLRELYVRATEQAGGPDQLRFLLQRLLYFRQEQARQLIARTARGELDLYHQLTRRFGTLDYFVRSNLRYHPWTAVFMYETNPPTPGAGLFDINAPFFAMGKPLEKLNHHDSGLPRRFDVTGLAEVNTEVLLIAGTKDPVAPLDEMERIHCALPNSRLAVFDASHCLQMDPEARQCRNDLVDLFFLHGTDSRAFRSYLAEKGKVGPFRELR